MFGNKKKDATPKKKEKMVFAKSKKEIVIMVIIWTAFFANSAHLIYKYAHNNSQVPTMTPIQETIPNVGLKQ